MNKILDFFRPPPPYLRQAWYLKLTLIGSVVVVTGILGGSAYEHFWAGEKNASSDDIAQVTPDGQTIVEGQPYYSDDAQSNDPESIETGGTEDSSGSGGAGGGGGTRNASPRGSGGTSSNGGSSSGGGGGSQLVTFCKAGVTCVEPGQNLCEIVQHAATNSVIVVRGNHSVPYSIGRCILAGYASFTNTVTTPQNVTLKADAGHDPIIDGTLELYGARNWLINGIDFTSSTRRDALLAFVGGSSWRVTGGEFIGAGGFTQIAVNHDATYGAPYNWRIDHNYLRDNLGNPAHEPSQDHNLYVISTPNFNTNGLIEENLFANTPHGTQLKIGSTNLGDNDGSSGVTVRNNTFVTKNNSNILLATRTTNVTITRNVLYSTPSFLNGQHIFLGSFAGGGISSSQNIMWGYDPNAYPTPAPVMYWNGGFPFNIFERVNINQSANYISQAGNIRHNPGYSELGEQSAGCHAYPAVTTGGVTYGASGCPIGDGLGGSIAGVSTDKHVVAVTDKSTSWFTQPLVVISLIWIIGVSVFLGLKINKSTR